MSRSILHRELIVGLGLVVIACSDGERNYAQGPDGGSLPDAQLGDGSLLTPDSAAASNSSSTSGSDDNTATIDVSLNEDPDSGMTTSASDAAIATNADSGTSADNSDVHDAEVTSSDTNATLDAATTSDAASTQSDTTASTTATGTSDVTLDAGDASIDSDSSSNTTTETDGGEVSTEHDAGNETTTETTSDETTAPVTIDVSASATGDWVGYPIVLAASGEASDASELSFSWEFVSVPDGSEINIESLESTGSNAQFNPDLAGDYVLRVTASNGEVSETDEVSVRADAFDVGYLNVAGDQDSWTRAGFMVRSDGTNNRQVGCYFPSVATSESEWIDSFQQEGQFEVRPYLPSVPDTEARLAYNYEVSEGSYSMYIAGPDNDCGGNPPPQVTGGLIPEFNPSGERVSVRVQGTVDVDGTPTEAWGIYTYSVDGSDQRVVRTIGATNLWGTTWVDNETILWVEADSDIRVYRAQDVNGAFENDLVTELVLDCSLATNPIPSVSHPVQRGSFLYVQSMYDLGAFEIWRLGQVAGGAYDCELDAPSNERIVEGDVRDFDVSPDGSTLTYFAYFQDTETAPEYSQLFLRNLDSMSEVLMLSGEPNTVASGAHFAAGGRQVVWTEMQQELAVEGESTTYSRPQESRVMIANIDGQNKRTLVSVSSSSTQVRAMHTGSNGSLCYVGSNLGSSGQNRILAAGLSALAMFLIGRRRRP